MKTIQFINRKLIPFALSGCVLFGACSAEANNKIAHPDPRPVIKPAPVKKRTIKLALILDTSNSMDGLIDQAKAQLWNIVNQLAAANCNGIAPDLQIALYQYGNDGLPASEGYVQLVTPLTQDLDQVSADLFRLRTNGGSEFCGYAINTALRQLDWNANPDDYKVIFIAGNEPFNQGNVSYVEVCKKAREKGVIINTIHCGNFQEGINGQWQNGAEIARGKYMAIDQNVKTEYIVSPYDQRISELNTEFNKTYIPIGKEGETKFKNMEQQDRNSSSYGAANMAERTKVKSSHVYKKDWDLTEAAQDKEVDVTKVEAASLPKEMQAMKPEQREEYVNAKVKQRASIKTEMETLNKKRDAYLLEKKAAAGNKTESLDDAILKAIEEQAKEQNFAFPTKTP